MWLLCEVVEGWLGLTKVAMPALGVGLWLKIVTTGWAQKVHFRICARYDPCLPPIRCHRLGCL